jgi:hypothetical protein
MKASFHIRLVTIAALGWANVTFASITFPKAVAEAVGVKVEPACTICHDTLEGKVGTVNKPFGRAMMAAGATAIDARTVPTALQALEKAKTDSDGDGVSDFQELKEGKDPNPEFAIAPSLQYGCSTLGWPSAFAFCLLAMLLFTRRVRARR